MKPETITAARKAWAAINTAINALLDLAETTNKDTK
jgi:hypothetical protein